jgi:putative ABC transport system permease protein
MGVAVGIGPSLAITRLISNLLVGVSATDPLTFVGVAVLLSLVALAVTYIPAHCAMSVKPVTALR